MMTQYSKDEKFKWENGSLYELQKDRLEGEIWRHVWCGAATNIAQAIKKYYDKRNNDALEVE